MNKNILITGASRGLGYALTLQYLKKGFNVFACARNANDSTLAQLEAEFKDHLYRIEMDVASSISVKKAADQIKASHDKLDVIINNAGIHAEDSFESLENVNLDHTLEVYNVNSVGALRVAKEFLELLQRGENKILLNISSEAGSISSCQRNKEFDYCMSKAAMNMGSVLLQNYVKDWGIKVLAVHPGWIRTDMGGSNADLDPLDAAENIVKLTTEIKHDLEAPVFIDQYGQELSW